MQAVHRGDEEGDGEPRPHHRVAEEAVQRPALLLRADHQGQLGKGIGQALVLHPLAAEQHGQGDHHEVEPEEHGDPPEQGLDPDHPGDRLALGHPLVESADRLVPLRHQPVRHMRVDVLGPLVLGGRHVGDRRQDRHQVQGQPHGADRAGDGRHQVGDRQLPRGQRQAGEQAPQRRVDEQGGGEEQEDGRGGGEVDGHVGAAHDQAVVGPPEGDRGAHGRAGQQRPHRTHVPRVLRLAGAGAAASGGVSGRVWVRFHGWHRGEVAAGRCWSPRKNLKAQFGDENSKYGPEMEI